MFKQILVTTDGSPLGNLALPLAADLARKYSSGLTLLYVVPDQFPPAALGEGAIYTFDYQTELQRLEEDGKRILDEALIELDYPPTQVVSAQQRGLEVAQVIAEEVELRGTDLVVMSTHGRRGLAHLFLGSVAEGVLRKLRIPVLLVRTPDVPGQNGRQQAQQTNEV